MALIGKIQGLVPSEQAVSYMYNNHSCFKFLDFKGYLIDLSPSPFTLGISTEGEIYISPTKKIKGNVSKAIFKALKRLTNIGFLIIKPIDPFEEFEYYSNIPLNIGNLQVKDYKIGIQ